MSSPTPDNPRPTTGSTDPRHDHENNEHYIQNTTSDNARTSIGNPDPRPSHDDNKHNVLATNSQDTGALSLSQRAPVELVATKIREVRPSFLGNLFNYKSTLEQPICVRLHRVETIDADVGCCFGLHWSRAEHESTWGCGLLCGELCAAGFESTYQTSDVMFPYPTPFQKAVDKSAQDSNGEGVVLGPVHHAYRGPEEPVANPPAFTSLEASYSRLKQRDVITTQPMHVVIGIFPRGHSNPKELVVFVSNPEHLFSRLHRATFRLRGLRKTFLSLSHVRGFRVYKCNTEIGTHERVELDKNGIADLQLLLYTYKKWWVSDSTARLWANWIHATLNNGSNVVPDGTYSLEIVLGWSGARIAVVVLVPVLLSLAIGVYINSQNWTDLTTIQTAWSIASYVVTSGGRKSTFYNSLSVA
ncbi:hypothetical protein GGR51DRAFT_452604 [Nemania sp. FL0031]|nr:hypothetical protein GGR51DRAFT_452604 [Nemania sp. FL0031]